MNKCHVLRQDRKDLFSSKVDTWKELRRRYCEAILSLSFLNEEVKEKEIQQSSLEERKILTFLSIKEGIHFLSFPRLNVVEESNSCCYQIERIIPPISSQIKVRRDLFYPTANVLVEWSSDYEGIPLSHRPSRPEAIEIPSLSISFWGIPFSNFSNFENTEDAKNENETKNGKEFTKHILLAQKKFRRYVRNRPGGDNKIYQVFILPFQEMNLWWSSIQRIVVENSEGKTLLSEIFNYTYMPGWKLEKISSFSVLPPNPKPNFSLCTTRSNPCQLFCFQLDETKIEEKGNWRYSQPWQISKIETDFKIGNEPIEKDVKMFQIGKDEISLPLLGTVLTKGVCTIFMRVSKEIFVVQSLIESSLGVTALTALTPLKTCGVYCQTLADGDEKYGCGCPEWIFDPTSLDLYEIKTSLTVKSLRLNFNIWKITTWPHLPETREEEKIFKYLKIDSRTTLFPMERIAKCTLQIKKGYIFVFLSFLNSPMISLQMIDVNTGKLIWDNEKGISGLQFCYGEENIQFNVFDWDGKTFFVLFDVTNLEILNFQGEVIYRNRNYARDHSIQKLDFFSDKVFCANLVLRYVYFLPLSLWLKETLGERFRLI